jgi:hypothetical protein
MVALVALLNGMVSSVEKTEDGNKKKNRIGNGAEVQKGRCRGVCAEAEVYVQSAVVVVQVRCRRAAEVQVQICRGDHAEVQRYSRGAEVQWWWCRGGAVVVMQRCRETEVQRCRGAEVQKRRGAEAQRCRDDAEV